MRGVATVPVVGNQLASASRDSRRNVEINVGKACNNKCVFCLDGMPSKADKGFILLETMKRELARWRSLGHESVGFLGGEPTMYPGIVESIRYARELGYTRIAIATNAMMFRRQEFVDRLIGAGLTRVTVSMHGHTVELEDKLTAVPGAFIKKCEAIARLRVERDRGRLRDGLSVNVVLNGWNYRALPRMMKFFFEKLHIGDLRVNFVRPEGYAEGNAELTPTLTEVVPVLMKAILLNEHRFRRTFTFGGVPLCVLPAELLNSGGLMRKYAGDVFRDLSTDCSVRSDGHGEGVSTVEEGRARFNWQDRKRFDLKNRDDACGECALSSVCEGLWHGYVEIYGTSELSPLRFNGGRLSRATRSVAEAPSPNPSTRPTRRPRRLPLLSP